MTSLPEDVEGFVREVKADIDIKIEQANATTNEALSKFAKSVT